MIVHPDVILVRTEKGEEQLKNASVKIDQRHKVALWLIDGVKSVAEILDEAGEERTIEPWYELIRLDMIRPSMAMDPPVCEMNTAQQKLACIAICHLGNAATQIYKIIENMDESTLGMADTIRKIERLVKLTIDASRAQRLSATYRDFDAWLRATSAT